jgi:uncharacterized Zn finger protein (UPF0148 family)
MSISFSKTCPTCGAPTEPEDGYRSCVECEWDSAERTLFEQTDDADERPSKQLRRPRPE